MKHKKIDNAPKITALYERLSREDGGSESISIQNQKKLLEDYCFINGFSNPVHYTDDGYSGASFHRPAWAQLMADVESGKVGTIIVKDMSRVGRNYLEVGQLTEVLLPRKGVRFIAVANGMDSDHPETGEFAPILNLVNEWYVKNFSQRMKAAWEAKRIAGEHTSTVCRYGYRKDPANPEKWLIDEEAADVVRKIFQLALDGKCPSEIARILHREQVEKPSYYRAKRQPCFSLPERPYDWDATVIRDILTSKEYIGMTVNHKKYRPTYKDRSQLGRYPKDEWQYIENTHEPIISEEVFYGVQDKLVSHPAVQPIQRVNPLKGLVYCADCGAAMFNKRQNPQPLKDREGSFTGKYNKGTDGFECRTFTTGKKHKETICSRHWVSTETLQTLTLETLKSIAASSLSDEKTLLCKLAQADQNQDQVPDDKKLLHEKQTRSAELDRLIEGAYEASFKGKLTDGRLSTLVAGYEAEQERLEQEIVALTRQISEAETPKQDGRQFLKALRQFTFFDTLTPEMAEALVDRIVVHERIGTRSDYQQEIEIYFKFIGKAGDVQ